MPMNAIRQFPSKQTSVLFICDDNSRYSLACEALVRSYNISEIRAFSAGIDPADKADPFALSALTLADVNSDGLWPKHWDGFAHPYRKIVDLVVILGKETATRLPRNFPGEPKYIMWDFNGQDGLRYNYGIWRDILKLRPYVDELVMDLQKGLHIDHNIDLLAAE